MNDSCPRHKLYNPGLSASVIAKLLEFVPEASITRRDLGLKPLPYTVADYAVALESPASLATRPKGSLDFSEEHYAGNL